ncbi:dehydrogenase/reductase SDR family member 12-like [Ischnura elegans]|uniref:dehydrogenase/reductase SDR family member 12-like n=1 Tax=Ischnura elegans TaxID=197161 RepID=UPI001ED8B3D4|nr:dehydrogenase/reductase SDR family member 12-like [Ischnura elegans]
MSTSYYRLMVWYLKGKREYTRLGYEAAAKNFREDDLKVDCKGKVYVITGANSGIGKSVALEVAKKGGVVHMVCRNRQYAETAKNEIVEASGNQDVHVHILDLSVPRDVVKFANEFQETVNHCHVLVNNAGCMLHEKQVDADGLEKNFATNSLGTHILTRKLLPLLKKAEKSRVVNVASGGMLLQKLAHDDIQLEKLVPFDGTTAYSQQKRQQVTLTEMYAKENPEVHFSVMHPGWADTPAVRSAMPDFHAKMKDVLRTPEQGADTALWLAISDKALEHPSGLFFQDRAPVATHLPLAWTKSTDAEKESFMKQMNDLFEKFDGVKT